MGYICLIWYVGCFPLGLIAMFSGVVMDGLVCFIWVLWLFDFVVAYRFAVRDCGGRSGLVCVLDAVVRLDRFWLIWCLLLFVCWFIVTLFIFVRCGFLLIVLLFLFLCFLRLLFYLLQVDGCCVVLLVLVVLWLLIVGAACCSGYFMFAL